MKNFHLPLPEETHTQLTAEAERMRVPATTLARQAVDWWLRQQVRKARQDAIASYAAEMAGTRSRLRFGIAAIEHLVRGGRLLSEPLREVEEGLKAAMDLD